MRYFLTKMGLAMLLATGFALGEMPSFSIQHTEYHYINQGYCSYLFTLKGEDQVGALEITLNVKDVRGETLSYETIYVDPFGGSRATSVTGTFLEVPCLDAAEFQVVKVVESHGNSRREIPLSNIYAITPDLATVTVFQKE